MATAVVTEAVEIVLDSRSHPGEKSYPMILNERERRLQHLPGTECEAVARGSRFGCWHESRTAWAAIRFRRGLGSLPRRPDDRAKWGEWLELITLAGCTPCTSCTGAGVNDLNGRCRHCSGRGWVTV